MDQQVHLGTFMLIEEADHWWDNARQRLENSKTTITWVVFREMIMVKNFPANIQN